MKWSIREHWAEILLTLVVGALLVFAFSCLGINEM